MPTLFLKQGWTLPFLAIAGLSLARPAAADPHYYFQHAGDATLNSQGLTGAYTADFTGGAQPTDTFFDEAVIYSSSTFTLQNGASLGSLNAGDDTTVNIQGGSVLNGITEATTSLDSASHHFALNVSGGTVRTIYLFVGQGTTTISGGTVGILATSGSYVGQPGEYPPDLFRITGGSVGLTDGIQAFNGLFDISGGTIGNIEVENATFDFTGSNLAYQNGYVTGLLTDGTAIDSQITGRYPIAVTGDPNHLILEAGGVPEAATTVSFGLLLALGMSSVIVAAKRKKQSA